MDDRTERCWRAAQRFAPGLSVPGFLGMTGGLALGPFVACDSIGAPSVACYEAEPPDLSALGLRARGDGEGKIERLPPPLPARRARRLSALLGWAARELQPPFPHWCAARRTACRVGWGAAAYALCAASLEKEARPPRGARAAREQLAGAWLERRGQAVAFLREIAGAGRTPEAVRLRQAVDLYAREAEECLAPLARVFTPRVRAGAGEAVALLREAERLTTAAAEYVAEAALTRMGVEEGVCAALLAPPDEPLAGAALHEVVYLARAGAPPLRKLAARRLAGADSPQAAPTLVQLLYDADARTFATALWALGESGGTDVGRALLGAARGLMRDDGAEGEQRACSALCALASMKRADGRQSLEELLADEPPDAVRACAEALLPTVR